MDYSKLIGAFGGADAAAKAAASGATAGLAGLGTLASTAMPVFALAQAADSIGGALTGALAGGNTSKVGEMLSSIPLGSTLGGIVNAAFGSNIDETAVQGIENQVAAMRGQEFDSGSTTGFLGDYMNRQELGTINASDVGTQGWFSNAATQKASDLNKQISDATKTAQANAAQALENLSANTKVAALKNYYALGGNIIAKKASTALDKYMKSLGRETGSLVMRKGGGLRLCGMFADGGDLNTHGLEFSSGLTQINEGGTHGQNPYGGVLMGIAPDGQPNLVEEGESIWNDYVFSDRTKVPEKLRKKYKLPEDSSFSDAAKRFIDDERPNDPIARRTSNTILSELRNEQEMIRAKKQQKAAEEYAGAALADGFLRSLAQGFAEGGHIAQGGKELEYAADLNGLNVVADAYKRPTLPFMGIEYEESLTNPYGPRVAQKAKPSSFYNFSDEDPFKIDNVTPLLRYAPLFGTGAASISGLFGDPDTSTADQMMRNAGLLARRYTIPTERVSAYRTRRPYDERYAVNLANQNYRQALRNVGNVSGGNRAMQLSAAGLAGYNNQLQLGEILRSSYLANRADDAQVAEFNRSTDLANAQMTNARNQAQAQLDASRDAQYVQAANQALAARQAILDSDYQGSYMNLTNLFNNLGALGREAVSDNMLKALANEGVLDFGMGADGKVRFARKEAKGGQLKKRRF